MNFSKLFLLSVTVVIVASLLTGLSPPELAEKYLLSSHVGDNHDRSSAAEIVSSAQGPSESDLEFCLSSSSDVNENSEDVRLLLDRIVRHDFFRFVRVNTHRECPYWFVNLLCTSAGNPCNLCTCDAKDVPFGIRNEGDMGVPTPLIDTNDISHGTVPEDVSLWGNNEVPSRGNGRNGNGGIMSGLTAIFGADGDANFVDLLRNPEANTGYVGEMANRIWDAIYSENCFPHDASTDGPQPGQCAEQGVFYRLISGLHASISAHIGGSFFLDEDPTKPTMGEDGKPQRRFRPECSEIQRRIHDHPERRKNLYIMYQFVLRALSRLEPQIMVNLDHFETGNEKEDANLREQLGELFQKRLLCSKTFDDVRFLESPSSRALLPSMKVMLTNITTLMDCLTCEKCRLWGKVQTHGVAVAFRVVMTPLDTSLPLLRRPEVIALFNLARQLATSIHYVQHVCPAKK